MRVSDCKVLVIEDDPDISELIRFHLENEGFKVFASSNGRNGLQAVEKCRPALILLDLMLPDVPGLEVCRSLQQREESRTIPLIILTARSAESDIVLGLELGADDYVTKPFSPRELVARVRAVLRRARSDEPPGMEETIRLGPLEIDPARHEVRIQNVLVNLTLAEFRLLSTLASRPGRVFTRDQLLEKIAPRGTHIVDRNVDVHIRAIRRKLKESGALIVTVRGLGYKCRETPA